MTKEDIISMAHEAGLHIATDHDWMPIIALAYAQKFAELVAAAERQRIHEYLMRLHLDAGGKHNYLHVAAVGLEDL